MCKSIYSVFGLFFVLNAGLYAQQYIQKTDYESYVENSSTEYVSYSDQEIEREALMAAYATGHVDEKDAIMKSTSFVNWTKCNFVSDVSMDVEKAGIPLPSGKATSVKEIEMKLPVLVKDPLLSIYVDDSKSLGDLVLDGTITLEKLTRIIDNSRKTPAVFAKGGGSLLTKHTINLQEITSSLIKHHRPYTKRQPIERISSRSYTGIVLDARGLLPVHGEFSESKVFPCLFPKVYKENMDLVYERNMVNVDVAKKNGIVYYSSSDFVDDYKDRVGTDPLWITVKKVYGVNRCDPVISEDDYLRIVSVDANLNLIKNGRLVILLDKELLEHEVVVPLKNRNYYIAYHQMKRYFFENKVPDVNVSNGQAGLEINMHNLGFKPDSYELLPKEKERVKLIAESLKKLAATGDYEILVKGHTADINKPEGQMLLSVQRAQEIINELVSCGMNRNIFSYRGYGANVPIADNSTDEGRAKNRRVEIVVMPKGSKIITQ